MQNLKIRVNSADESKEIQNILESTGFKKWVGWSELGSIGGFIWTDSDMTYCDNKIEYFDESPRKEITLPELRAMVNPMKEYLNANCNYEFVLSNKKYDGFIEIPNGAIRARFYPHDPDWLEFENSTLQWWHNGNNEWINYESYSNTLEHSRVVWQREQDEPFLTPETTLNDQYAEIEEVRQIEIHGTVKAEPDFNFGAAQASGGVDATLAERQSQYGCYEDVAHVTQQILSALRVGNYDELPAPMKESLHMIASKMARIVNGDPKYLDNWHDIGGYAKLIEKLIKGE